MPLAVFVLDGDARIQWLNDAATRDFGLHSGSVLNLRFGEAVECAHAHDVPGGCGRGPACAECTVRSAVSESIRGQGVTRRRARTVLLPGGTRKELDLLITTSPMAGGEPRALVVIEDMTEISTLRAILPMCAKCKKIRNDRQYWQSVEAYFRDRIGVEFSHGLCGSCIKELYPDSLQDC
jgi:hypothetical protein